MKEEQTTQDKIQRAVELVETIGGEAYYGFNLKCVFADMAHTNPDEFEVIERAFNRAKQEREEATARNAARRLTEAATE